MVGVDFSQALSQVPLSCVSSDVVTACWWGKSSLSSGLTRETRGCSCSSLKLQVTWGEGRVLCAALSRHTRLLPLSRLNSHAVPRVSHFTGPQDPSIKRYPGSRNFTRASAKLLRLMPRHWGIPVGAPLSPLGRIPS